MFMYLSRISIAAAVAVAAATRIHYGHVCWLPWYADSAARNMWYVSSVVSKVKAPFRCDGAQQKSIHVRLVHNIIYDFRVLHLYFWILFGSPISCVNVMVIVLICVLFVYVQIYWNRWHVNVTLSIKSF